MLRGAVCNGFASLKVDKQDLCVLWESLSLLEQSFLCQNSGTNFWHKPFLHFADGLKQGSCEELAERGGVLSKQHVSRYESMNCDVFGTAKNALKAITDIKAQILAHVPDRQDEEE